MKLIIGNHVEESITKLNTDDRIFPQRAFWMADEGDIVILSDYPNKEFLDYVSSVRDINAEKIKIFIVPSEKYDGRHFDTSGLLNEDFLEAIKTEKLEDVKEVLTFWHSLNVAKFIKLVGLTSVFQGYDFFSQNGVEFVNSKATFRALSSAAKIKTPEGAACLTKEEAFITIKELFSNNHVLMVKQVHNGAGVGNEIIAKEGIDKDLKGKGAKFVKYLRGDDHSIKEYLNERWPWASNNGSRTVVIEVLEEKVLTLYAEFLSNDDELILGGLGSLGYEDDRLMVESAPLRNVPQYLMDELISEGRRLANIYRDIGYRGFLSADAILTPENEIIFTEMNCRIGGSLHIYEAIANYLVRANDEPIRTVTQHHSPITWKIGRLEEVFKTISACGVAYNKETRKGVIIALPIMLEVGGFLSFCVVYENEDEHREYLIILNDAFSSQPIKEKI